MIALSVLTPFYFLKAGSLVSMNAVLASTVLIGIFLAVKIAAKFLGVWPLAIAFRFGQRKAMYTTLLMSTGLTFGTISALYGLSHELISQDQYTILVTAVILSAVVPTPFLHFLDPHFFDPISLGLLISCARATRGRGLPSLDARSGRLISPRP